MDFVQFQSFIRKTSWGTLYIKVINHMSSTRFSIISILSRFYPRPIVSYQKFINKKHQDMQYVFGYFFSINLKRLRYTFISYTVKKNYFFSLNCRHTCTGFIRMSYWYNSVKSGNTYVPLKGLFTKKNYSRYRWVWENLIYRSYVKYRPI